MYPAILSIDVASAAANPSVTSPAEPSPVTLPCKDTDCAAADRQSMATLAAWALSTAIVEMLPIAIYSPQMMSTDTGVEVFTVGMANTYSPALAAALAIAGTPHSIP